MSESKKPAYLSERWSGPASPRLLLVDDDMLMRRSVRRFLQRAGFEVIEAASPLEALTLLESGASIDVAVIDLEMPQMNGVELMRRLEELFPGLPMGLFSASNELQLLDRDELEVAWFVKSKMAPIGELVQAVCKAVYGQRDRAEGEGHHEDPEAPPANGHANGSGAPPNGSDARESDDRDSRAPLASYMRVLRPAVAPAPAIRLG